MLPANDIQRVLVLDDDEIMHNILQALLALEGFEIAAAFSGNEALQLIAAESFDLVLTDLHMPGLEGHELAQQLRHNLPSHTLLIAMSSLEPSDDLRLRFDAFLLKPFDVQLLRDAMASALQQKALANGIYSGEEKPQMDIADTTSESLDTVTFDSLAKIIPVSQLSELYAMALKDIGKRHVRMTEAAAAGDLEALQREAHAMKGSCGMIGAVELQNLAATVEEAPDVHTSAVGGIPQACTRLQRMLETKFHTA